MVTWECQLIFSMRHRSYSLASLTQNHIEIAWSEISLQHCRAEKLSLGVVRYMAVFGWQALGLWAGWRGGKERGGGGLGWERRGGEGTLFQLWQIVGQRSQQMARKLPSSLLLSAVAWNVLLKKSIAAHQLTDCDRVPAECPFGNVKWIISSQYVTN